MSFVDQRIRNRFPVEHKLRNDPSSFGARLFSVFGDYYDFAYAEIKRTSDDRKLIKEPLGIGEVYNLFLTEQDYITSVLSSSGKPLWNYPTVEGTTDSIAYPLTRVDSIDALCWTLPNRIEVQTRLGINNFIVYSDDRAGTIVNNVIDVPSYIDIKIGTSNNFYKRTAYKNVQRSGKHQLTINAYDINYTQIKEVINVRDDGVYRTSNVISEIINIIPEGFDGPIECTIGAATDYINDTYRTCVTEDGEGPLKISLSTDVNSLGTTARIFYYTDILLTGEEYRDGQIQISNNVRDKWEQYLLTSTGSVYTPIDIAIHPNNTRLYALDSLGRIHIYNHGPSPFIVPTHNESLTQNTYLEIMPVKHWARVDETLTLFTRWSRRRFPIIGISIFRITPGGVTEYLQANKTWGAPVYEFLGNQTFNGFVENSWNDFSFTNQFDEFGAWEFYCRVRTKYDTTLSYTGVLVDSLEAERTLVTGVTNPTSIWFGADNTLYISSTNNGIDAEPNSAYPIKEYSDVYLADPDNQILYFKELYDSVEVT